MGFSEIKNDKLLFNFPELGADCALEVTFHRTLRLPDDNKQYGLPPSLGSFELSHVDDHKARLPEAWGRHGGAFLPMWQAEAMWLSFRSVGGWPFAVKIAAGKVNALSGEPWSDALATGKSDYMVSPKQPWIDGFNIGAGVVRQFVAMPQGSGYTVEEQVTGKAEHGGLQIMAYPMAPEARERLAPKRVHATSAMLGGSLESAAGGMLYSGGALKGMARSMAASVGEMGMAAGGLMRQEIYADPYACDREGIDVWSKQGARCFVHLMAAKDYESVMGRPPRSRAPGRAEYKVHNLPWFDYHDQGALVPASPGLSKIDSVAAIGVKKGEKPLPDEGTAPHSTPIPIGPAKRGLDGSW